MARYHAHQEPAEENPGEKPDSSGSGYIHHDKADEPMNQIHEDDGVGGVQKQSKSTRGSECTDTPYQNILNATDILYWYADYCQR